MRFDLWKSYLSFVELKNNIKSIITILKKWDLVCKKFKFVVGNKKKQKQKQKQKQNKKKKLLKED